jgi:hypothetical protein
MATQLGYVAIAASTRGATTAHAPAVLESK